MRGFLKIVLIGSAVITVLAGLILVGGFFFIQNCAGQMQACYRAWRSVGSATSPLQRTRELALSEFTASSELIVFPIPLAPNQVGLMVIDRRTERRRLIASDAIFTYPQLSADGKRLLFVRTKAGISRLLSCVVQDWQCSVAAEVTHSTSITWSTEFDQDRIIYVSTPLVTEPGGRQRFSKHDFYLSEPSKEPARLTNFEFYELGPLDIFDRKLMFKAVGGRNDIIPHMQPLARSQSEIFVIQFDPGDPKIVAPEHTLEPLYMIDNSYSISQTVSPDGSKVALINTRTGGKYRYDLVIATIDGTVLQRIEASTFQFSRAAFAGPSTVLANQLFNDRYEVTMVDLADYSVRIVATVDHSENALRNLEHIRIPSISN